MTSLTLHLMKRSYDIAEFFLLNEIFMGNCQYLQGRNEMHVNKCVRLIL